MCAWIQSDDTNGMALRYGDILANNNGFGIYLNSSDSWSFWRYAGDIDTLVSDNGKQNLHCLVYENSTTSFNYQYNLQKISLVLGTL